MSECLSYIGAGEGRAADADTIQRHLDDCDGCRAMFAEAARLGSPGQGTFGPLRTFADSERIAERYTIRRFLARGGMGEVYEAFDEVLGESVALKTLALTESDRQDAGSALLREVRLARRVRHPNVCRILELGVHAGAGGAMIPFLTMDLLAGETLSVRLARTGRISPGEALLLLRDVAAGLAAVHHAGVVHRDLKAANVFLVHEHESRELAIVMDFGLARGAAMNRGASRQQIIGTPTYMAPEQLVGDLATPASDVYAFGIVAFETLTGRLPFGGQQDAVSSLARLREEPPAPSAFAPHIDRRWDQLVARCLAREPERRFAGGAELMVALEHLSKASPLRLSSWSRLMIVFCAACSIALGLSTVRRTDQANAKQVRPDRPRAQPPSQDSARQTAPMPVMVTVDRLVEKPAVVRLPHGRRRDERHEVSRPQGLAPVATLAQPPAAEAPPSSSEAPPSEALRSSSDDESHPTAHIPIAHRRHPDDLLNPFP